MAGAKGKSFGHRGASCFQNGPCVNPRGSVETVAGAGAERQFPVRLSRQDPPGDPGRRTACPGRRLPRAPPCAAPGVVHSARDRPAGRNGWAGRGETREGTGKAGRTAALGPEAAPAGGSSTPSMWKPNATETARSRDPASFPAPAPPFARAATSTEWTSHPPRWLIDSVDVEAHCNRDGPKPRPGGFSASSTSVRLSRHIHVVDEPPAQVAHRLRRCRSGLQPRRPEAATGRRSPLPLLRSPEPPHPRSGRATRSGGSSTPSM
ncbi:hypothetical protein PSMK_01230 [Phycisphaera mikurensis NBRC 102666]|uniref:Uncharacterized protein n=1 Tax=Phycisphaera mikurensis (strain NBRC 102666 / KCTC 22515 / FYK2301M01) TaxID=1142394 RepID=I0IAJ4_PHYMF|nr:hypothetical protein PSMK_01230 [Phycisphaera mikurensis NBRC 102666]